MIDQTEFQLPLFSSLPPLDEDELDDAEFRAKDRAWSALVAVFEDRKDCDGLNYQILGDRIGRSRKQVQRWLSSSVNMTLRSIGLLAEGMDADLDIRVQKRTHCDSRVNHVHPSEAANTWNVFNKSWRVAASGTTAGAKSDQPSTATGAPKEAISKDFSVWVEA